MKKLLTNLLLVSIILGSFAAVAVPRAQAFENPFSLSGHYTPTGPGTCSLSVDFQMEACFAAATNLIMSLMARGLAITGFIFDQSLDWSLNFSKILAQVPVVDIGWKVLRDIANIAFIFIALWSGISITLGINAEKAWGLLAQMVLVALFINFSLFITKTVIDASNIAALHFYRLMVVDPGGDTLPQHNVSEAFMNGLKLQTLYNSNMLGKDVSVAGSLANDKTRVPQTQLHPRNILLIGVFGSIFMLIAAFVFLAAAIMFVIRTVTLMLLMLLSPLAFVAWLLPGAQGLAREWWSKLWSQSFFAPLYMALAYVVVATIQSPAFSTYLRDASFAAALTTNGDSPSSAAIIFNFVIMSALLIGCLLVAQKMGATGSGMVMKVGGKLAGMGTSLVKGGTVGVAGSLAARGLGNLGKTLKDRNTGAAGVMGRAAFRFGDQLQKAKVLGGHSYKEQTEEGTFFRVGEKEIEERLKKMKSRPADQAQYISNLSGGNRDHAYEHLSARDRVAVEQEGTRSGVFNPADIAALRTHLTAEEREKTEKAQRESTKDAATETRRTELGQFANEIRAAAAAGVALAPARLTALEGLLARTSEKEITELEGALLTTLAPYLRSSQMNAIQTNNELGQDTKDNAGTARYRTFGAAVTAGNTAAVRTAMSGWNRQERAGLAPNLLRQEVVIRNLDPKDLKEIIDKRGVDPATLTAIRSSIQGWATAAGVAGAPPLPADQRRLVDYFNSTAGQELFA